MPSIHTYIEAIRENELDSSTLVNMMSRVNYDSQLSAVEKELVLDRIFEAYQEAEQRERIVYTTVQSSPGERWTIANPIMQEFYEPLAYRESRKMQKEKREQEAEEYFRDSNDRGPYSNKLDTWMNKQGRVKKIEKMSIDELDEAYSQLKAGYKCRGQRNKIYSIERVLNEKRGGAQLMVV